MSPSASPDTCMPASIVMRALSLQDGMDGSVRRNASPDQADGDLLTPVFECDACGAVRTASRHADPACDGAVIYIDEEWRCGKCGDRIAVSSTCPDCGTETSVTVRPVAVDFGPDVSPSTLERAIHEAVNAARRDRGLAALTYDPHLAAVALDHSRAMSVDDFFGHESPEGGTPADRYDRYGYDQPPCGENVAHITPTALRDAATIAAEFVDGWLDSPGHRENLLSESWAVEGIGVRFAADGSVFATQNFA